MQQLKNDLTKAITTRCFCHPQQAAGPLFGGRMSMLQLDFIFNLF